MFKPIIAVDGRIVGTWKCTVRKTKVLVTLHPFASLDPLAQETVMAATSPYGHFLGLPVESSIP